MNDMIEFLTKSKVVLGLKAETKEEAFHEMLAAIEKDGVTVDKENAFAHFMEHEEKGSSGLGYGVAFPHTYDKNLSDELLVFGTSRKGIDFDSRDKKPVYLLMMFLTPEGKKGTYVKRLSVLADMTHLTMYVVLLVESRTEEEFRCKLLDFANRGGMRLSCETGQQTTC